MKEKYIALIKEKFTGPSQELLLKQVNLFYQENKNILTNKYSIGDKVKLTKGTFLHGIFGELENFDYTIENGFISTDFTDESRANKICNSVGMWNIQKDCLLKDYINDYSGFTITYTIGRWPGSKEVSKLIPYHQFDEFTENINNVEEIWTYWGTKTKEVSFLPSLVSEKRQIAFILNMDSLYAQELATADVWNPNLSEEILESFLDYRYYPKFLTERFNRTAATTDRESAIIFGLPSSLIEGVFVGRKIETNQASLDYIKNKLPNCYICNLDGVVIR